MAITSLDIHCDTITPRVQYMADGYKHRKSSGPSRLVKYDFTEQSSISSYISKQGKFKNIDLKSPYLYGDNLNVMSRVTEKKFVQKKGTSIVSSFPLAASLYKASSHEFKAAKNKKKVKKSVLTLPSTNNAPLPQSCTVSDMNEAEFNARDDDTRKKPKKVKTTGKKIRRRGNEFYNRDAQYCTQMNIDLDCSSTDIIKNYNGVAKCKTMTVDQPQCNQEEGTKPSEMWAVLRNINTFQFNPSPPMSEESFVPPKKKTPKRCNNRKNMRLVGTCRTEEFAYISSYELDSKSRNSFSQTSSFDKVTVIDRKEDLMCTDIKDKLVKTRDLVKTVNAAKGKQSNNRIHNKSDKNINIISLPGEPNTYETNGCDDLCGDSLVSNQNNKLQVIKELKDKNAGHENLVKVKNIIKNNRTPTSPRDSLIFSFYSGSSKGLIYADSPAAKTRRGTMKNNSNKGHISGDSPVVNGITKVVVNRGLNLISKRLELNKQNRDATFTLKSPKIIPKSTQRNIERHLSKLTYPIVVLGKDQLTDRPFEVINEEIPQFNGLDAEIWPYMMEWYRPRNDTRAYTKQNQITLKNPSITKKSKLEEDQYGVLKIKSNLVKQIKSKDLKPNFKKIEQKPVSHEVIDQVETPEKLKPLQQFRNRMIHFLYKDKEPKHNTPPKNRYINTVKTQNSNAIVKVEANKGNTRRSISPLKQNKSVIIPADKRPWSKTKWVSEFIDNVIRKVKNGVYYTSQPDNLRVSTKSCVFDIMDPKPDFSTSCFTSEENADEKTMQSISKVTLKKKIEPLISSIPGFDSSLSALEIETMNSNEISVKHCVTNIILRFDVRIPTNPELKLQQSCTFLPLEGTDQTRIFKCKTSILNAMLPAELCSLLPNLIKKLMMESRLSEWKALPPVENTDCKLTTIAEITQCESLQAFKISPEICKLLNGKYSLDRLFTQQIRENIPNISYESQLNDLIPHLSRRHLFDYEMEPKTPLLPIYGSKTTFVSKKINKCTALVPYVPVVALDPIFSPEFCAVNGILKRVNVSFSNVFLNLSIESIIDKRIEKSLENFTCINPFTTFNNGLVQKYNFYTKKNLTPAIEYDIEKKKSPSHLAMKHNKVKRRGFWMKSKSSPNIHKEKSTSLSKISNLDEFFKAMGADSVLSHVFENISARKIMSCILQMKNWTKEINPKQALLVILLTNKKETPNLLRCLPVLLQGISVNRITKAHELDMEIEVIEREQLNGIRQYDGISYLPASTENQDSLFEELCWIAKTTASDYERPFDDSSEKLLRSLLEKRKKLNPSYLRVMARYVGLGLLKSPGKK